MSASAGGGGAWTRRPAARATRTALAPRTGTLGYRCAAMRRLRHIRPTGAASAAALLAVMAATADAAPQIALLLAPFFLLLLLLSFGVFLGEDLLERLRARRWTSSLRTREPRARRPYAATVVRRVGRSFAFALAMRPPPAAPSLR